MHILIVGLGAAGQRHARNLRRLLGDSVEISAVRRRGGGSALSDSMQPQSGVLPEESLGIRVFDELDRALEERPDGVVVANPTSMHIATARAVVKAGCGLLLEKPLGHSWDGVPEFLAAASESRMPVLVGFQLRFHPLLERLRTIVHGGEFGPVLSAASTYGEYLPDWHPYEDYRTGYAARRDLGGGVLLTQIHDIDCLGWILGWPSQVYSVGGHLSSLEVDVDDTSVSLWPCLMDGRAVPVQLQQTYARRPPIRQIELIMERGRLHLDLLAAHLRAWDTDGLCVVDESLRDYDRNEMFLAEMAHFLECLAGREAPRIPAVEAAQSLAVALAALRSQASGVVETVIYPGEAAAKPTVP
ncbi:MAG: Gfo/Idh/MocA family oxidoreductase [Coriobacteriia bacterium]|nr:Gfo/Idh/MocA family oxidoreductase [Coriobacteriia bacterium]